MQNRIRKYSGMIVVAGVLFTTTGYAFDMGNVMNPSKWMGGNNNNNRDRYDDNYDRGYGGPGYGGPGYGYGGPGYGPDTYYGGAPGYGYGAPAYGGAPGYGYGVAPGGTGAPAYGGAPAYAAPSANTEAAEQIERLQERVRMLEDAARRQQAPASTTPNPTWGTTVQPGYTSPAVPSGNQSVYQYRQ